MTISDAHVLMLTEAGVLIRAHASVLSEFELETFAEVAGRFCRGRREAVVTELEWAVVDDAVAALRKAAAAAAPLEVRPSGGLWQDLRGSWS